MGWKLFLNADWDLLCITFIMFIYLKVTREKNILFPFLHGFIQQRQGHKLDKE